ncbi:Fun12p GTPase translation initiation factor IF2 [Cryptosporidium ubiquitum]|uniref:Eukaryotic translation initiation factor 5B n=1 Tax=Cryptosporidium ubiquitum TaxID=857276 RepID=A0A1J4MGH1_9CRYT|nr:Fun12p GTPase translation initiation factor IF2 [Cryptosporidium ubiquitum]OII73111.1 Fun12p GTPase translation initiation factor IF2 [Cryptosporidium ubiquitum]
MSGKKKNANKKPDQDLEDLDALLAEFGTVDNAEAKQELQDPKEVKVEENVSSQTLKNRLKKQKKKQAKSQASATEDAGSEANKDNAKPKYISAAAKAAAERLRLIQENEQEMKRREEEEKRKEEERRKLEEEELLRINEEKLLKQKQRKERREQLKAEGKLLSAKEKAERQKREQFVEYLKQQGVVSANDGCFANSNINVGLATRKKKNKSNQKEDILSTNNIEEGENCNYIETQAVGQEFVLDSWEKVIESEVEQKSMNVSKDNINDTLSPKKTVNITDKNYIEDLTEESDEDQGFRSPVCCILGHVDTGKTKLLDKMRRTNVQDNEAGGITQQIGATYFPPEMLSEQVGKVDADFKLQIPGLLFIDTPGHESFNNLRSRGSSLCDIAVLVVDIMHGLEPQTRESIGLLRSRKCPFIIALNKIDRLYGWIQQGWSSSRSALSIQNDSTRDEFDTRLNRVLLELSEEGLNCDIYWKNDDFRGNVSIVPTSAVTGEGVPDLIYLIAQLTQNYMGLNYLKLNTRELSCTILEVKAIDGLGVTIDVILVSGILREGDTIVVCGLSAPIVTTIRALLTPQPMHEMRVKGEYIHHRFIKASMGVKICANGLDDAVAGTQLLVPPRNSTSEDIELLKEEVMKDMGEIFSSVDKTGNGVYVMASTLGSLEALLVFLKSSNIPVVALNIGTVHKSDVRRASIMHERGFPEMAVILAFDIKVDSEAEVEAKKLNVRIMKANIIYHLCDMFSKYYGDIQEEKKKEKSQKVVFPCILKIIPQYIFNSRDPIICGVYVEEGILKPGTPLCVPEKDNLMIGRVISVEFNKKPVSEGKKGQEVAVKIQPFASDTNITYGRHFDHNDRLVSRITRDSIDILKQHFRDELSKDDWKLVIQLKKTFGIP